MGLTTQSPKFQQERIPVIFKLIAIKMSRFYQAGVPQYNSWVAENWSNFYAAATCLATKSSKSWICVKIGWISLDFQGLSRMSHTKLAHSTEK
jgi:hypothetical protein